MVQRLTTGVKSKEINWILKYRWAINIFNYAFLYNCMDVFYPTFCNVCFLPHLTIPLKWLYHKATTVYGQLDAVRCFQIRVKTIFTKVYLKQKTFKKMSHDYSSLLTKVFPAMVSISTSTANFSAHKRTAYFGWKLISFLELIKFPLWILPSNLWARTGANWTWPDMVKIFCLC